MSLVKLVENRKLSILHSWASSSQVHAHCTQSSRQPAPQLNAKQATAGLRQVPPVWECRRKRSVLRFQTHQQAVWAPDREHTHIPLRHLPSLLNAHLLVSVRPGTGFHHIAAHGTGFCPLHGLGPQQTLYPQAPVSPYGTSHSVGWSAIQEWLTEGILFPGEVASCASTGAVNPFYLLKALGFMPEIFKKLQGIQTGNVNETTFCKRGKNSSAAISCNQKGQSKHPWAGVMGTQRISRASLGVQCLYFNGLFQRKNFSHQRHSLSSPCLGTTVNSKRLDRHYWRTREYNSKKSEVTDLLVTMITSSAIEDISLIVR